MQTELLAMFGLFVMTFLTSIAGLVLLPSWMVVFGPMAGVSGLGLGVAGYAIRKE
ncbi:hypothetical protein NDI56_10085 [Haloarcula sp. S1CR25-12]|uniref:Uncharacterized protein n=1 Tax=Haloarcula saliterrae TaxID=2950534 RepID=A0ABU2FD52_9EURY|nr:hypothetical protein [Haloarcula sp. S1CR25-12]MDS0259741.1 hypothetical protein [Haloarcula sp. S1CR25-12]